MRKKIRKGESDLYKFDETIAASVTFGYIGQINEMKGVGHLVEAGIRLLSEDNNIRLIIAGSLTYDEQFSKEICNYIPSKYSNKIKFIGEIEDIDTFFEHIDVLCIPSIKQEPLANVLSEAKYHHCPSIIYPSGGLPELITHKRDGYYNVPQISDRELSQKMTLTLYRYGKDNSKKIYPGVQGQGCLGSSERIVNQG